MNNLFEKEEKAPNSVTEKEGVILYLNREAYFKFVNQKAEKEEEKKYIDGILKSDKILSNLLKSVSMKEIMKKKPDIPDGMSCMALKIENDLSWSWVFGNGTISGSMFSLHESVDGSVEEHYRSIREKHNAGFTCNCECHNPDVQVRHMMPCCDKTYQKMFTRMI